MKKPTILKIILLTSFILGTFLSVLYLPLALPADNIQGLYHPFRDIPTDYPNGVPYKNSLITDPVRQQLPWKYEVIRQFQQGQIPLWNPYSFSGTPLLANIQSGVFYPLNILFFFPYAMILGNCSIFPHLCQLQTNVSAEFLLQWSLYIYLQSVLGFVFLYLYLRQISLSRMASIFGGLIWIFCGFSTAWWSWGNIGHTILWFPLILWSLEKILSTSHWRYYLLLLFSLCSSFFAGHWQTFFFIAINTFFYLAYRVPPFPLTPRRLLQWLRFTLIGILFVGITSVQWLPSVEFIQKSAREVDPLAWQRADWFFPYEHFFGLIAPDYFGNPSTQNYWGIWNYGEFASYIGLLPLIFAIAYLVHWSTQKYYNHFRKLSNTLDLNERNIGAGYFLFCLLINFILITHNPISELPYHLQLPFISSTQPSRGIVMVNFSLAILSSLGFHYFFKQGLRLRYAHFLLSICLFLVLLASLIQQPMFSYLNTNFAINVSTVTFSNLRLPLFLLILSIMISLLVFRFSSKLILRPKTLVSISMIIIFISTADLLRFFTKFNSFVDFNLAYPQLEFLMQNPTTFKYMTDDSRILAPNMNIPYQQVTVEGYDPLYFSHYGKFIGMWVRDAADLSPFPANRTLTPHNWQHHFADIAGVDTLYTLNSYNDPSLTKLAQYGLTQKYRRETSLQAVNVLPSVAIVNTELEAAEYLFSAEYNPQQTVLLFSDLNPELTEISLLANIAQQENYSIQDAYNMSYFESQGGNIRIDINNQLGRGSILYLPVSYDNGWQARLNNEPTKVYRANFSFLAIALPKGQSSVQLFYLPQSFILGSSITLFSLMATLLIFLLYSKFSHDNIKSIS